MRLKDKTAIITGGAGGIGRAIARKFMTEGANIVLADLNEQKLAAAVQSLTTTDDQNVVPATCNVSVETDVQAAVKTAIDHFSHLDIVVNNAGLMTFKPIEEQTEEDWTRI